MLIIPNEREVADQRKIFTYITSNNQIIPEIHNDSLFDKNA